MTPEQQKKDEAQCHTWAVQQSKYDPTKPPQQTAAAKPPACKTRFRRTEDAVVGPDTQLVIEGFPRTANTFTVDTTPPVVSLTALVSEPSVAVSVTV